MSPLAHVAFSVRAARYAKGQLLVQCPSDAGFKPRAGRLLEALKCRWTNRECGYVCSPAKLRRLVGLLLDGWDATYSGVLVSPPENTKP